MYIFYYLSQWLYYFSFNFYIYKCILTFKYNFIIIITNNFPI
jgi:hypothetical protein